MTVDTPAGAAVHPPDFAEFFRQTLPGMLARALLLCGNQQDAEDAVQDAYLDAVRNWSRIGGYDAPDAWVYKLVRQRLAKVSRRTARQRAATLTVPRPPAASVEQTAEAHAVLAALATLPRRQRTLLVLHTLHGMAQQDIADELGLRRGTVAATIFKARRTLEGALGMTDPTGADADRFAPVTGPRQLPATTRPVDRLALALADAELWLEQGIAADQRLLARIGAAITGGQSPT